MVHNSAVAPFHHEGGQTGVLLCHGFTGSPASLRPWAAFMARHGCSVSLPLLPGHGTQWQDLTHVSAEEWTDCLTDHLQQLRRRCDRVFVFGLSMGGTLALRLAQTQPADVTGLVLVNPLVHRLPPGAALARWVHPFMPSQPAIGNDIARPGADEHAYPRFPVRAVAQLHRLSRQVVADIATVSQPLLVLTSRQDHVVHTDNSRWLLDQAASQDREQVLLEESFHVATLDHDAERIQQASLAFVRRLGG